MKILCLTHRTPYPPQKGTQVRPFRVLSTLAERGHEVHLLAFAETIEELSAQVELAKFCASVTLVPRHRRSSSVKAALNLLSPKPLSFGYFGSRAMRRAVRRVVEEHGIEAVYVWSSTMTQYVPAELASRAVIDMGDVDSEKYRDYARELNWPMSWVYGIEWKRLRRYEYRIIRTHAHTVLIAPREIALLDELDEFTRHTRLHSITNGVDLERFRPDAFPPFAPESLPPGERRFLTDPEAVRIVFTGAMDYYPNVEAVRYFAEEVLPLIRQREPRAEFLIVGSDPTPEVIRLAEQPGVKVTGFVKDVRPYLAAATVCVIPLRIARGVQNKALEAMASGRAVVASPDVVAGLKAEDGEHLLVARDTAEYAAAVLKLIADAAFREELGEAARRFVEDEYNWTPLMEQMAQLIESTASRTSSFPRRTERHSGNR
ncbi:MAG TPA: TIGR03087 family PEP-CTERM/XrtA system glycosyltransferase [Blastocatellia bacterium]|nr:TIGR03087 family PEP-CTERM/XrtA system glycosyltransferase [Blastocatellia bacterium]